MATVPTETNTRHTRPKMAFVLAICLGLGDHPPGQRLGRVEIGDNASEITLCLLLIIIHYQHRNHFAKPFLGHFYLFSVKNRGKTGMKRDDFIPN